MRHMLPARRWPLRHAGLMAAAGALALLLVLLVPSSTETAVANGDTRSLNLYHNHTGESLQVTYRVNGSYDPAALERLNYFLRDWRNNDVTRMDPRLFDVIWEAYRTAGATSPIHIVSAYRSPQTNAMLRARSRAVAEHSQHILGRAMDTTMPGLPMERIREIGMRLQRGGVGWYPGSNFVHLDVGNVRSWPRMSYDQLVRLFPDGKTVHLAADGRMLPRYQEARAEIASRGGVISDVAQASPFGGGLFAWLFGKHDEESGEEKEAVSAKPQADRPQRGRRGGTEVAAAQASAIQASAASTSQATAASVANSGARLTPPAEKNTARALDLAPAPQPDSTEAAGGVSPGKRIALAPLPPPRPDLLGDVSGDGLGDGLNVALARAPLPPGRPASLTRLAKLTSEEKQDRKEVYAASKNNGTIDTLDDATQSRGAPALPVVITQGPKDRDSVPKQILAFASDTHQQAKDAASSAPGQPLSGSGSQAPAAAGLGRPHAGVTSANFTAPSILGPSFTGLRRASRIIPGALSKTPTLEYVPEFTASASDLDTSHFSGAAAKPLALAQGFVRIGNGSGPASGN